MYVNNFYIVMLENDLPVSLMQNHNAVYDNDGGEFKV